MLIVSNTSPIMNLAVVGQLELIEKIYEKILIPKDVLQEILAAVDLLPEIQRIEKLPWIDIMEISNKSFLDILLLELDLGEAAAISLAIERQADIILLDEIKGRKIASRLGLKYIGLLGILIEGKRRGFIDTVKPILDQLITGAGFWIAKNLYNRVIQEVNE
ncbi:MAG: DUF3368 domain-containing protein [bacterium]